MQYKVGANLVGSKTTEYNLHEVVPHSLAVVGKQTCADLWQGQNHNVQLVAADKYRQHNDSILCM